ncbi:NAD-dependent epimerase/dehydratase family protein [Aestuariivirga sp.]|uniref:NAD-dependent epimerase/dehydratase family protein n=1 Tax=Aestuariivirga sp. TaxID=2650926 RepID=UPI003BA9F92D
MPKIVITGAAGLVGQNVIARLKQMPGISITGIDMHPSNTALLRHLHPEAEVIEADLSRPGTWEESFRGADAVLISQAQIGGLDPADFSRNNVTATENIVAAMRRHGVPYFIHISSSVVHSTADDFYTRSKSAQERYVATVSDIPHLVLRPTLMFGWFDRKHLGWIRRFMARTPIFPVPGNGEYIRQPLYVGDFAQIIISALQSRTIGIFDISGLEKIGYLDLIRMIRSTVKSRTIILRIPYWLFWWMLRVYGAVRSNPPFTTAQLEALVIPETFPVIDWPDLFGVTPTPLRTAIAETFLNADYSAVRLDF